MGCLGAREPRSRSGHRPVSDPTGQPEGHVGASAARPYSRLSTDKNYTPSRPGSERPDDAFARPGGPVWTSCGMAVGAAGFPKFFGPRKAGGGDFVLIVTNIG